eukprot:gene2939-577_t
MDSTSKRASPSARWTGPRWASLLLATPLMCGWGSAAPVGREVERLAALPAQPPPHAPRVHCALTLHVGVAIGTTRLPKAAVPCHFCDSEAQAGSGCQSFRAICFPRPLHTTGNGAVGFDNGLLLDSTFNQPHDVQVQDDNIVYVSDTYNDAIRVVKRQAGTVDTWFSVPLNKPTVLDAVRCPGSAILCATSASISQYVAYTLTLWPIFFGLNHVVHAIPIDAAGAAGIPITLGGLGVPGFLDNTDAANARFDEPWDITQASDGSMVVTEYKNHALRQLLRNPDGTWTVRVLTGDSTPGFQDGPLSQAKFFNPTGIIRGPESLIYVADTGNQRIRRIDVSSGQLQVVTVAGSGAIGQQDGPAGTSTLRRPTGIALDDINNLIISDTGNHVIRYLDFISGEVSTAAGRGQLAGFADGPADQALFNANAGMDFDFSQKVLIIADKMNHRVRSLTGSFLSCDLWPDPGQCASCDPTVAHGGCGSCSADYEHQPDGTCVPPVCVSQCPTAPADDNRMCQGYEDGCGAICPAVVCANPQATCEPFPNPTSADFYCVGQNLQKCEFDSPVSINDQVVMFFTGTNLDKMDQVKLVYGSNTVADLCNGAPASGITIPATNQPVSPGETRTLFQVSSGLTRESGDYTVCYKPQIATEFTQCPNSLMVQGMVMSYDTQCLTNVPSSPVDGSFIAPVHEQCQLIFSGQGLNPNADQVCLLDVETFLSCALSSSNNCAEGTGGLARLTGLSTSTQYQHVYTRSATYHVCYYADGAAASTKLTPLITFVGQVTGGSLSQSPGRIGTPLTVTVRGKALDADPNADSLSLFYSPSCTGSFLREVMDLDGANGGALTSTSHTFTPNQAATLTPCYKLKGTDTYVPIPGFDTIVILGVLDTPGYTVDPPACPCETSTVYPCRADRKCLVDGTDGYLVFTGRGLSPTVDGDRAKVISGGDCNFQPPVVGSPSQLLGPVGGTNNPGYTTVRYPVGFLEPGEYTICYKLKGSDVWTRFQPLDVIGGVSSVPGGFAVRDSYSDEILSQNSNGQPVGIGISPNDELLVVIDGSCDVAAPTLAPVSGNLLLTISPDQGYYDQTVLQYGPVVIAASPRATIVGDGLVEYCVCYRASRGTGFKKLGPLQVEGSVILRYSSSLGTPTPVNDPVDLVFTGKGLSTTPGNADVVKLVQCRNQACFCDGLSIQLPPLLPITSNTDDPSATDGLQATEIEKLVFTRAGKYAVCYKLASSVLFEQLEPPISVQGEPAGWSIVPDPTSDPVSGPVVIVEKPFILTIYGQGLGMGDTVRLTLGGDCNDDSGGSYSATTVFENNYPDPVGSPGGSINVGPNVLTIPGLYTVCHKSAGGAMFEALPDPVIVLGRVVDQWTSTPEYPTIADDIEIVFVGQGLSVLAGTRDEVIIAPLLNGDADPNACQGQSSSNTEPNRFVSSPNGLSSTYGLFNIQNTGRYLVCYRLWNAADFKRLEDLIILPKVYECMRVNASPLEATLFSSCENDPTNSLEQAEPIVCNNGGTVPFNLTFFGQESALTIVDPSTGFAVSQDTSGSLLSRVPSRANEWFVGPLQVAQCIPRMEVCYLGAGAPSWTPISSLYTYDSDSGNSPETIVYATGFGGLLPVALLGGLGAL